jgi:hypothetical protein
LYVPRCWKWLLKRIWVLVSHARVDGCLLPLILDGTEGRWKLNVSSIITHIFPCHSSQSLEMAV